jgi:hypothetical protein
MLRRLVSMHPNLGYELVHERPKLLHAARDAQHAIETMTYPATQQKKKTGSIMSVRSGQKIPYATFSQAKGNIDKFRELFPKAYLMHIIREPLETISSQVKTFNRKAEGCIKNYFSAVPLVHKYVISLPNSCTVCYENLVVRPQEVLASIYEWMGTKVSSDFIAKAVNTKDPWEWEGRIMPGLRYFDSIISKDRKLVLKKSHIDAIKSKKALKFTPDF